MSFIIDKILALIILLLVLSVGLNIYQYQANKHNSMAHKIEIEQMTRHVHSLTATYEHKLDEQHIAATKASNERLKTVLAKQQAITQALNKANEEAKKHEKINKTLTNQLKSSNDSLHKLTKEASRLAKKTAGSSRECVSSVSTSSNNNSTSTKTELPERLITASTQMGNDFSQFAEKVVNDYAQLQGECKQLYEWSKVVN